MGQHKQEFDQIDPLKDIINWLLTYTPEYMDVEVFLDDFSHNLARCNIPIWRSSLNVHSTYSDVIVRNIIWTENEGCQSAVYYHVDMGTDTYLKSPVAKIYNGSGPIRRKLSGPNAKLDFPICVDIAKAGGTDYFIAPLKFTNGVISYISFTTKYSSGFSDEHIFIFEQILPYLSMRIEIESSYFSCTSMLNRFVGRFGATKIENGEAGPGRKEEIEAVIFYCHINSLKKLSMQEKIDQNIGLTNLYFESIYNVVTNKGGEVISFSEEGVLCLFEIGLVYKEVALKNALKSLRDVFSGIIADDNNSLSMKIFVDVGKVIVANIGCNDRSSFTLLGEFFSKMMQTMRRLQDRDGRLFISKNFKKDLGLEIKSKASLGFYILNDDKCIDEK